MPCRTFGHSVPPTPQLTGGRPAASLRCSPAPAHPRSTERPTLISGTATALRNSYYDAAGWFAGVNGVGRGTYFYQQDIGGTLSAKIPSKLFAGIRNTPLVFASYEELRIRQPLPPEQQYVPDSTASHASSFQVERLTPAFPNAPYVAPFANGLSSFPKWPIELSIDARIGPVHLRTGEPAKLLSHNELSRGSTNPVWTFRLLSLWTNE